MLLLIEGFEGYGRTNDADAVGLTNRYTISGNQTLLEIDDGRFSESKSLRSTNGGTIEVTSFSLGTSATIVTGFALKVDTIVNNLLLLELRDGATTHIVMRLQSDGELGIYRNTTLLGTTTGLNLLANNWYHIGLKVTIDNSAGAVELRVGEATVLNLTSQDTQNGGSAQVTSITLRKSSSALTVWWDDWYIADTSGGVNDDFLGNVKVAAIFPDGEGNTNDWTPSAGSDNSAMVDETTIDGDSTYVEASVSADKDLYTYDSIPGNVGTILGVQVNSTVRETDASPFSLFTVARSNTTESDGSAQPIGTTNYIDQRRIIETDPDTASAWTESGVNAAEFGVKIE